MYMLTGTCCLLDPKLAQDTAQFYITQSVWIMHILEKCAQVNTHTHTLTQYLCNVRQEGGSKGEVEKRQREVMSGLPEYFVRDMTVWFRVIAIMKPVLLQGLQVSRHFLSTHPHPHTLSPSHPPQVTQFVDCCVSLLERPDLLPNPLAQSRIVSVLLAFVDSDQRGPQAA